MQLLLVAVMSLSEGGIFVHLLLDVMAVTLNPNSSLEQQHNLKLHNTVFV